MDLLVGVQVSHVLLERHRVKGHKMAKLTGEPLASRVSLPPVLDKQAFI